MVKIIDIRTNPIVPYMGSAMKKGSKLNL